MPVDLARRGQAGENTAQAHGELSASKSGDRILAGSAFMDVYEVLYTTRAMRRVMPEPIPFDAQARILDAAIRAPSGGNTQPWRFLLVDDPGVKAELGPLYRESIANLWATGYQELIDRANADPEHPANRAFLKVQLSAQWLADHFEEVPLYLFCFVRSGSGAGSIYPAAWSAQLAARRGHRERTHVCPWSHASR